MAVGMAVLGAAGAPREGIALVGGEGGGLHRIQGEMEAL